MNERKGPLPEFFDGYILKGPSVNRSFEERETSRRLSVSEELLNLTNQSQQRRQKEHHEKVTFWYLPPLTSNLNFKARKLF